MKCYVAERDRITSNNAIELPFEYRRVVTRLVSFCALGVASNNRSPSEPGIQFGTAPTETHVPAESKVGDGIDIVYADMSTDPALGQGPTTGEFAAVNDFVFLSFGILRGAEFAAVLFHFGEPSCKGSANTIKFRAIDSGAFNRRGLPVLSRTGGRALQRLTSQTRLPARLQRFESE